MQQEYIRGISAWNFNLEDLKNQAALIHDYDENSNVEDAKTLEQQNGLNGVTLPAEKSSPEMHNNHSDAKSRLEDTADEIPNLENSFAAFPIEPLQALEGCFDICEDDVGTVSPTARDENPLDTEQQGPIKLPLEARDQDTERVDAEHLGRRKSLQRTTIPGPRKYMSGSLLPDNVLSPNKLVGCGERDHPQPKFQAERSYSGPLQHRQKNNMTIEDVSEGALVQRKGRFKVTEADLSPKAPVFNASSGGTSSFPTSTTPAASLIPSLQSILQHNTLQREEILRLIKFVEQTSSSSGNSMEHVETGNSNFSQIPPTPRERALHSQVIQLQQSIGSLVEQLQRQKMRNAQVEKKLGEEK